MVYRPEMDKKLCFVLMPFGQPFDEYYDKIIKRAVKSVGLKPLRADEIYKPNVIIKDIWKSIWKARIVIADVTGKNPNVNYELGLCHALGVPTILIANSTERHVPFDYQHYRCIFYDVSKADWSKELQDQLKKYLNAVLAEQVTEQVLQWPYSTRDLSNQGMASPLIAYETGDSISSDIARWTDTSNWLPTTTERGLVFPPHEKLTRVLLLQKLPLFSDGVIECEVWLEQESLFNVIVRGDIFAGEFYMARCDTRADWPDCIVFSKGGMTWQTCNWGIAPSKHHSPHNQWITMRIHAIGRQIRLYREGLLVDEIADAKIILGKIGFFAEIGHAYVRKIRIYS